MVDVMQNRVQDAFAGWDSKADRVISDENAPKVSTNGKFTFLLKHMFNTNLKKINTCVSILF